MMKMATWAFICLFTAGTCIGAEIRNIGGSISEYDKTQEIITKSNSGGLTIWSNDPIPVKPQQEYQANLRLEILHRVIGAAASFQLVLLDAFNKEIARSTEADPRTQVLYGEGAEKMISLRLQSGLHGSYIRMELKLAGNPMKVKINAVNLAPYTAMPLFPGIYNDKDPMPSRMQMLRNMERLQPSEAWIEQLHGQPVLMLDGKQVAYKAYKGSADFRLLGNASSNFVVTHVSGTTLFWDKNWDLASYIGNGEFDFTRLEDELIRIHAANPNARVIISVECDPDSKFLETHPDSIFCNSKGERGIRNLCGFGGFGGKPDTAQMRHWAVSYASQEFQDYIIFGLNAMTDFLKKSPAGKIVVGFALAGGHDGQFVQWEYSGYNGQGDYSLAHRQALQRYLREKYQTESALQKAWNDVAVTFATAQMFTPEEWRSRPFWSENTPGIDRKISDCREFISVSTARMLNRFGKALQDRWGRRCIIQSFYSSAIWRQTGRLSLDELARGGHINLVAQVSNYAPSRLLGNPGASANFCISAAHLRNMIYVQELDHRTWRTQMTNSWVDACEPKNVEDFRNQVIRDAGMSLAYGGNGFYFYDMYGSWYHDKDAAQVISETYKMADWAQTQQNMGQHRDVAIFLDERERFLMEGPGGDSAMEIWQLSGLTPDIYLLDDLCNNNLPDYKFYIVLSPVTLNPDQLTALQKKACRPGKVLLLTGSPGALHQGKPVGSARQVLAQLGIKVKDHVSPQNDTVEFIKNSNDPLLYGCIGRLGCRNIVIEKGEYVKFSDMKFYTSIDDSDAKILGFWQKSKLPALAVKRSPSHGTLIYCSQFDGITPELLYNAANEAQIQPFSEPGNAVYVGHGIAAVHRLGKPITLKFPAEMEFFEPISGFKLGEGWIYSISCKPWCSRAILYRPKINKIKD